MMHLPCKQVDVGALPTDSISLRRPLILTAKAAAPKQSEGGLQATHSDGFGSASHLHCGENEIQASLISSASVGAIPAPATKIREVSRLPDCKSGVAKSAGSDDWSVTSTSHQFWIRSSISGATRCLREG